MVQHRARSEPLLRGAADLAGRARDVVERLVGRLDADLTQPLQHPVVEIRVRVGEAHPLHELRRHVERVRDDVALLHHHRAAARDAAHDVEAVALGALGVDLVLHRLERADHDRRLVPLPEAQRRLATPLAHPRREHLVEGEVQARRHGWVVHDLPLVVRPARGIRHRPAHRDRDRLRGEAEHHGVGAESRRDRGGDLLGIGCRGQALKRTIDITERVVGFEEEVTRHTRVADHPVDDLEVDDDELAARDLVFTVHGLQPTDAPDRPTAYDRTRGSGVLR